MKVTQAWCAFGLGSNLGDRAALLGAAFQALKEISGLEKLKRAPLYETAPIDCPEGSPSFLNTVVEAIYTGDVTDLLTATQQVEIQLGRERSEQRNEARLVDIDLLMVEGVNTGTSDLTLPHPRMHERLFVLRPLADLKPELVLPTGTHIQAGLEAFIDQEIQPFCG